MVMFCGGGGDSEGLRRAGFNIAGAVNHNPIAIEAHEANFRTTWHDRAVISDDYNFSKFPRADILSGSPICTEISPAGGRKRDKAQMSFDDLAEGQSEEQAEEAKAKPAAKESFERTRTTAWCLLRAAERWNYKAVMCENVTEFVTDWLLFPAWRLAWELLGYNMQIVSVTTAHVGTHVDVDYAPQWRDRCIIVMTRKDIPKPDLRLRPWAYCTECDKLVRATQSWRNGRRVGKYKQQYDYVCPNRTCKHAKVEPYTRPVSDIVDWNDLGTRIGDRKPKKKYGGLPLAPNSLARIEAGLALDLDLSCTIRLEDCVPLPGQTGARDPFVVEFRRNRTVTSIHEPMSTVTAQGGHHGLLVPPEAATGAFYVKNYSGNLKPEHAAHSVTRPLGTVTVKDSHSLVIPYRNAAVRTTAEPLHTVATKAGEALLRPSDDVMNSRLRMFKSRERFSAQGFPVDYFIDCGTAEDQTMLAGNATSVNVAQWVGQQLMKVL
jgi:DNA (cytosine-5)-methyltransferase 1